MQVLDLCAGAADAQAMALAAAIPDQPGQIYAADPDDSPCADLRQACAIGRAQCPGAGAERPADVLADLKGRCDLCSSTHHAPGPARGRAAIETPDGASAPSALEQRIEDQDETLESAVRFVGRAATSGYVTCSVLRTRNEDRIAAFLPQAAPR